MRSGRHEADAGQRSAAHVGKKLRFILKVRGFVRRSVRSPTGVVVERLMVKLKCRVRRARERIVPTAGVPFPSDRWTRVGQAVADRFPSEALGQLIGLRAGGVRRVHRVHRVHGVNGTAGAGGSWAADAIGLFVKKPSLSVLVAGSQDESAVVVLVGNA